MTEAEWNEWVNAEPMLRGLHGSFGKEKIRQFGCSVYRRVWNYLGDELRTLLDATEDWTTSAISLDQWRAAWDRYSNGLHLESDQNYSEIIRSIVTSTYSKVLSAVWQAAWTSRHIALSQIPPDLRKQADKTEKKWQADALRDVIGNPFRSIILDPSWLTSTVLALAQQMYDSRDFSPMPILADALQDAGCDNEDILNHCRGPGPHCRGCFVIDLLTGRE